MELRESSHRHPREGPDQLPRPSEPCDLRPDRGLCWCPRVGAVADGRGPRASGGSVEGDVIQGLTDSGCSERLNPQSLQQGLENRKPLIIICKLNA